MQGPQHRVLSYAGSAAGAHEQFLVWSETTDVEFDTLPAAAIQAYVASGDFVIAALFSTYMCGRA
jgi:predicted house-cleaning NTP pyrophosphatase (Maf/HAM1 superfamily)